MRETERPLDAVAHTAPGRWTRIGEVVAGALIIGLLSACGGGATPTAPTTPTMMPTAAVTATVPAMATARVSATPANGPATATVPRGGATPSATATRGTMEYPDVVRAALAQAATEIGVAPDQLKVVTVEARDWPDSSLGCPQPGRAYSQIVTPGYRVVVEANGKQYDYRTNRATMIVRCTP